MAKITLSKGGFTLIPEGVHTFKIVEVDDSKYENFGKIVVKLQTAKGQAHTETFSIIGKNGEINEGALKAWSYFARVCLNNFNAEEIDTQDIVGCFITATVKHEKFTRTKGENAGSEGTSVRLNDYTTATSFGTTDTDVEDDDSDDMDDLDDLDELDEL